MTTATTLLALLKKEETALRDRNLTALDALMVEKQQLLDALGTDESEQNLNAIRAQASENAALFEIVRAATRSAQQRLDGIAKQAGNVAYDGVGAKLSYTEKPQSSRRA
ncbi:MAG: hypothetical protein AAF986_02790 [Pseudomonadota bacterium]